MKTSRIPALLLAAALTVGSADIAVAQAPIQDPNLAQTVTDSEDIAPLGTPAVLDHGHADLGPMLIDGHLDFLVRDDSAEKPVWRHLEDVVFPLRAAAEMNLPDGGQFDFTGAKAGDKVWVVPQTEIQNVVWLGWNTQHPSIVKTADRGVNLEFLGAQGPGQYSLFLQSGGFAKPQKLFSSAEGPGQKMWVDLNTHTHANWVFTQPGVYQIALKAVVKGTDGSVAESTKVLKFAVGESTSVADAASAQWKGEFPRGGSDTQAAQGSSASFSQSNKIAAYGGLGLLAVALLLGLVTWRMQATAAQRRQAARAKAKKASGIRR
ncbi:choice-of-anchor M domain-containing protein [Staphylococcus chromogenes]|nr:choice-of-anchor M domain-containing protein [Staphylococcus chromogenes]